MKICLCYHVHTKVTNLNFPLATSLFRTNIILITSIFRRWISGTKPFDNVLEVRVDKFLLSELFSTFVIYDWLNWATGVRNGGVNTLGMVVIPFVLHLCKRSSWPSILTRLGAHIVEIFLDHCDALISKVLRSRLHGHRLWVGHICALPWFEFRLI